MCSFQALKNALDPPRVSHFDYMHCVIAILTTGIFFIDKSQFLYIKKYKFTVHPTMVDAVSEVKLLSRVSLNDRRFAVIRAMHKARSSKAEFSPAKDTQDESD